MSDEGDKSFHCEIKWIKVFTGSHLRAELLVPLTVHLAHTCLPFQGKPNLEKSSMVTAWSYWSEPPVHNTEQNVCNAHTKEYRIRPTRESLKRAHWGERLLEINEWKRWNTEEKGDNFEINEWTRWNLCLKVNGVMFSTADGICSCKPKWKIRQSVPNLIIVRKEGPHLESSVKIFLKRKILRKRNHWGTNLVRKGRPGAKCEGRWRLCSQNMVGNVHCLQLNNNTDAKIEWTCLVDTIQRVSRLL